MTEITVKPLQGESYIVRHSNGFGWGVITIDEASGLFMAYTDYGNFGAHWNGPGDKGLKHFLGTLDYSYAMGKLAPNHGMSFDGEIALKNLRKQVHEAHRRGEITKDQAREAKDDLDDLDDEGINNHEHLFYDRIASSRGILDVIGHDDWWHAVNGRVKCHQCVGFWNNVYIPFVASYMPDHKLQPVPERAA